MGSDDEYTRKPEPLLTHKNWRSWFEDLDLYFQSKEIDFAISQTQEEYARIALPFPITAKSTTSSTPSDSTPISSKDSVNDTAFKEEVSRLAHVYGQNLDKATKYKAASAKCMLKISKGIDDLDKDLVREYKTAKERWHTLWTKYSKTFPQDTRRFMQQITSFQYGIDKSGKPVNMTIDEAWTILREARRRIAENDPDAGKVFGEKELLGFLMAGLPSEFDITCQTLDMQPSLDVNQKVDLLRRAESTIKGTDESANAAFGQKQYSPRRYQGCYFCGGEHNFADCDCRQHLVSMVSSFKLKEAKARAKEEEKPTKLASSWERRPDRQLEYKPKLFKT